MSDKKRRPFKNTGVVKNNAIRDSNISNAPPDEHKSIISFNKDYVSGILRGDVYRLAKLWMRLLSVLASTIFLGVISVVVGLGSWAPPPFFDLVRRYPTLSVITVSLFALISFLAWFVTRKPAPQDDKKQPHLNPPHQPRRLVIATITSTTSSLLCLTLLAVVFIRPPWCPDVLCPAPKLILNPAGIHDSNLELIFHTIQSSTYLIPGNPENYTLGNLPLNTSALRIDAQAQKPYRVIVGIHSIQQGRIGLIVEQVILLVKQVTLVPYPLHVWVESETRDYHTNLYQVYYGGQDVGARLLAIYTPPSRSLQGHVQLIPGESDELDIQVMSRIVADLHFQVQIVYRVINEPRQQSITLSNVFEVIFSNKSDWYPYHLHEGHFVANS